MLSLRYRLPVPSPTFSLAMHRFSTLYPDPPEKPSYKDLFRKYGLVAALVHFPVSFLSMFSFWSLFRSGMDPSLIVQYTPLMLKSMLPESFLDPTRSSDLGAIPLALLAHKAIFPLRLSFTLMATPFVSRYVFGRK